jgi:hypothetical protein
MFSCVNNKCKSQSKFALRAEFTKRKYGKYVKSDGKIFYIDRGDPKLKMMSNWKAIKYNNEHLHSKSNGFQPHIFYFSNYNLKREKSVENFLVSFKQRREKK